MGADAPAKRKPPRIGRYVTSLAEAADGTLWVACEEFGLSRNTPDGPERLTVKDGLAENNPYVLAYDDAGRLSG